MFLKKFKKFGGEKIPNIIDYIMEIYEREPNITISIGNDSVQKRRKTMYANTIMIYNQSIKNGAHCVFYRESVPKIYDIFTRLYNEANYMNDIGNWLSVELKNAGYVRKDLNSFQRKAYKFMILREQGEYKYVPPHYEEDIINGLHLTDVEKSLIYKEVDLHLDFNPKQWSLSNRLNKSFKAYGAAIPWLRGQNFRVMVKPYSHAATSSADLLLKT